MPRWASTQPPFLWLPSEDIERSRSIGTVSDGWLINAVEIPQPHDHLRRIESHQARQLDFATQEMIDLIEAAAKHVADEYPGSVLYLGNFGADGGGDIPFSVSHNSGRDGDLAFYMLDAAGKPATPDDLHSFDGKGRARVNGKTFTFDAARNWALIEGLIENASGQIQFIFVSRPLRKMLLAQAKKSKADAQTMAYAEEILIQPGGALPHNDHFHVRLYCAKEDVESGCINGGSQNSLFDDHESARLAKVNAARKLLSDADADVRLAAVHRLALLRARDAGGALAARLEDEDRRVRSATVRALSELGTQEKAVAQRLTADSDPYVLAETVWALGDFGTASATEHLTGALRSPRPLVFDDGSSTDLRTLVADALSVAESKRPVEALIKVTKEEDQDLRLRANRALKMLTNADPAARPKATLHDAWKQWWVKHKKKSRDAWLLDGFRRFGVKKLSLRYVWELTAPVLEDDHLSYNAQRVLMRLAKRDAPSLEWPKSDANFYWRRWFERRCPRLGCPKVPKGLTTLD